MLPFHLDTKALLDAINIHKCYAKENITDAHSTFGTRLITLTP